MAKDSALFLADAFCHPATIPLQQLCSPLLDAHGVAVYVKREDLIHPIISGNKWHKLKYNLSHALTHGYRAVASFGGAYSNHIHALAHAGKLVGLQTIGVIRGEAYAPLNPTLDFAQRQGMRLHYVTREQYRDKESLKMTLSAQYADCYWVPEGGSNDLAVLGCRDIVRSIDIPFDVICCACGTGGTLAGIIAELSVSQRGIGFSVLRGGEFLRDDVTQLLTSALVPVGKNWHIESDYHFGGYAKAPTALKQFIGEFERVYSIPLDPVYTAKLFYGVFDLISKGYFARGTTLVVVHSGGLQGRGSLVKAD